MAINLKKWKQRNAAERVKAALTRPEKNETNQRLRRQFSTAAEKAFKALKVQGRNPWLKYGYNDDVVVTAKLKNQIIAVTGDEAIALKLNQAEAYLKDVIEATNIGQLDRELLAALDTAPVPKAQELKLKTTAVVTPPKSKTVAVDGRAPVSVARAPVHVDLRYER